MAGKNNYMQPPADNPQRYGQSAYVYTPQIRIFEAQSTNVLELQLQTYLTDLTTPFTADTQYYVRDIKFSSAQEKNNKVSYSAMVHLEIWTKA